ncbi:hypothetical protein PoB_000595900 [Plakobranchus ocellatus]|uniref:Uncharacterized protein n=1 Tax=Plakobranchus ocellatus TaxID=259542 RepID=A0AAV3Y938_9GAST|nr:hypothetical protein PoB_000595900 [Plakobranchus ocellatus]
MGWLVYVASPQQCDLRLSDQDAGGEVRTRDRRFPADLRAAKYFIRRLRGNMQHPVPDDRTRQFHGKTKDHQANPNPPDTMYTYRPLNIRDLNMT